MRATALVLTVLILSAVAAAEEETDAQHPLGCWAGLAGGEWHAEGRFEAGTPFAARLFAEWGPERSFLRVGTFIPVKDGEYLRYDSVYYRHPGKNEPAYLSASYDGEISEGTFQIAEDLVTFVYPGPGGGQRTLRSTWEFVTKDQCRWTVWQEPARSGTDWTKLIAVDYHRKDAPGKKRYQTKPPTPHLLAPLTRLVGGRFAVTGLLGNGTPVTGAIEHSFGVTHQVMITKTFVTQGETETLGFVGFTWWDPGQKAFRMIEFSAYGVFSEGLLTVKEDTMVLAFTTWSKAGAKEYRQWTVFETDDRISWYVEEKTADGWKKVTERMVGERAGGAAEGE